jgi:hypothetical protein
MVRLRPVRLDANSTVAADGCTQQFDNIGIIEEVSDLSKIALVQLGIAFAIWESVWRHFKPPSDGASFNLARPPALPRGTRAAGSGVQAAAPLSLIFNVESV